MQLVQQPAIVYPILLPVPSPIGRTKTSPAAQDFVQSINLAVYSCSNYRMYSISTYLKLLYTDYFTSIWFL